MDPAVKNRTGERTSTDGPKVKSTKKRAKASSPAHADLLKVRKLASMAVAELTRTGSLESPTPEMVSAALDSFAGLMNASLGVAASASRRIENMKS